MIVVAWLYNTNGMASWCWEAAHALAEAGKDVLLICRPGQELPGVPRVEVLRFEAPRKPKASKVHALFEGVSCRPRVFLPLLHETIVQSGRLPAVYLLNQSDLLSADLPVPQLVAAWANPPTLVGYLRSIGSHAGWSPSKAFVRTALNCIGWYRKDWRAYRTASAVLAVSQTLARSIACHIGPVHVVHPGTALSLAEIGAPAGQVRLIAGALNLDDPRKGIRLILDALGRMTTNNVSLTLVGQASESLRRRAGRLPFHVSFTGILSRSDMTVLLVRHDIFLFASLLDDWGYVLVEALAAGLWVVAPAQSPFDEIVGEAGQLFRPRSSQSLAVCIERAVREWQPKYRQTAISRATSHFSREAFARQLSQAITMSVVLHW